MSATTKKVEYLQILLGNDAETKLKVVHCERPGCKSVDVKQWSMTHKSADEGESVFSRCRECKFVWCQEEQ